MTQNVHLENAANYNQRTITSAPENHYLTILAVIAPITPTIATVWMCSATDVISRVHYAIAENVALLAVFIANGRTKLSNMMVKTWSLQTRIYNDAMLQLNLIYRKDLLKPDADRSVFMLLHK